MNEIDFTKVLPEGLEMTIGLGLCLLMTVISVLAILFVKRWKGRILPLFLGLVASIVVSFVPTALIISLMSAIPSVGEAFTYNPQAYIIINCGLLAVTGLLARYVAAKMMVDKYERQGDIYMVGLGVGIGGAINYAMTAISMYVWCVAISADGLETLLGEMSAEEALATYESIEMMYVAPVALWIIFAVNAVLDIIQQMVFTNMTYGILKGKINSMWYAISALVSFLTLITFQMYDVASLNSILIWFAVKLAIFFASAYYVHMILAKNIEYKNEKE